MHIFHMYAQGHSASLGGHSVSTETLSLVIIHRKKKSDAVVMTPPGITIHIVPHPAVQTMT